MTSLIGANMADIPDPLEWTTRLDLDPSWDEPVVKKDLLVLSLRLDQRFNRIEQHFDRMDTRFDGIDKRLDAMDTRIDGIDKRLDAMDTRIDGIDKRLDRIDKRLDAMDGRFDSMETRFEGLEMRMDRFEERLRTSRALTHAHIVISALAVIVPFFLR